MSVSILIPAHDQLAMTVQCLETVLPGLPADCEVVLIDDASTDATPQLAGRSGVRYVRLPTRSGFARAIQRGAEAASGETLLLLNNDTVPQPGWLAAMRRALRDPSVGIVGARLIYPGTHLIQHAGMTFSADRLPHHIYRYHDASSAHVCRRRSFAALTGACLLVERELFAAVGGLDESYSNGFEDVDLCLRVGQLGFRCLYEPDAVVLHYEGVTAGRFDHVSENLARFRRRWGTQVVQDDLEVLRADGFEAAYPRGAGGQSTPVMRGTVPAGPSSGSAAGPPRASTQKLPFGMPTAVSPDLNQATGTLLEPRIATPARTTTPLCWLGPLYDDSHAASHGRDLCLALARRGVPLRIVPSAPPVAGWIGDRVSDLGLLRYLETAAVPADAVAIAHPDCGERMLTGAAADRWQSARRRCLRFSSVDAAAIAAWNDRWGEIDRVWASSLHQRSMLLAAGCPSETIGVVPAGVSTERFHLDVPPLFIEGAHGLVVLAVVPWRAESGWDVLIRAYLAAFSPGEDVTLLLYTGGAAVPIDELEIATDIDRLLPELTDAEETPDIVILSRTLSPDDYAGLLAGVDLLVAPERSATDGRTQLEALATGVPVLAGSWNSPGEWMNDRAGARFGGRFTAEGLEVEPDEQELEGLLRLVADQPTWITRRRLTAPSLVGAHGSIDREASALIEELEKLEA